MEEMLGSRCFHYLLIGVDLQTRSDVFMHFNSMIIKQLRPFTSIFYFQYSIRPGLEIKPNK